MRKRSCRLATKHTHLATYFETLTLFVRPFDIPVLLVAHTLFFNFLLAGTLWRGLLRSQQKAWSQSESTWPMAPTYIEIDRGPPTLTLLCVLD